LRYVQRVSLMQRSLLEDSEQVKASLRHTERLRERAQRNFEVIDRENAEETSAVEAQITEMERAIADIKARIAVQEAEKARATTAKDTRVDQENVSPNEEIDESRQRLQQIEVDLRQEITTKN
jgi:peptidoglycan hydrolase CwlO-like protein